MLSVWGWLTLALYSVSVRYKVNRVFASVESHFQVGLSGVVTLGLDWLRLIYGSFDLDLHWVAVTLGS